MLGEKVWYEARIPPFRVLSSIANRRPMGFFSIPRCPIYPDIPRNILRHTVKNTPPHCTPWEYPKVSHAQYPQSQVSIPSHCTMGSNGHTGESQAVPCTVPQSQVSIPSHCTMGSNGHTGESQAVPCTIPQSQTSYMAGREDIKEEIQIIKACTLTLST